MGKHIYIKLACLNGMKSIVIELAKCKENDWFT